MTKSINMNKLSTWSWKIARFILILGLSFVIIYPILQKISTAFKHQTDLYSPIVVWIPETFTLDNFRSAMSILEYGDTLLNTFVLSATTAILTTASCALAGYAFARLKFKGSGILFFGVILTIVVPPTTILIPMYMNLREFTLGGIIPLFTGSSINLLNSYWPFILTSITGTSLRAGLYIFIFNQFFRGLPKALEEAAYMDGANVVKTFFMVMLPNAKSAMVTVLLFSFVWQWNDSFFTTTYLTSANVMATKLSSLPYNLKTFLDSSGGSVDPFYLSMVQDTGILLAIAPLIILYLFVQKQFVESVERTGIVG